MPSQMKIGLKKVQLENNSIIFLEIQWQVLC